MWAWDIWFGGWAWYRRFRGGDWRYRTGWRDNISTRWRRFPGMTMRERLLRWMARFALTSLGLETFGLDKRPAPSRCTRQRAASATSAVQTPPRNNPVMQGCTAEVPLRILQWSVEQMKNLREYADDHPMKAQDVLDGLVPPAGDTPGHVLIVTGGMKVVYSIESDQPAGPSRHLSISVNSQGKWPNPAAVQVVAQELGFRPGFDDGSLWEDQPNQAINWLQTIEPPAKH